MGNFCSFCGTPIPKDYSFCGKCGSSINDSNANNNTDDIIKVNTKKKRIILISITISIILLASIILLLIPKSKSNRIIGTWSLYAWKENGIFKQVSGKKTYAFNEETVTITSKTGKSRTYYYKIVDDKLYYVNAKYELEDLGSINESQTFKITQLDSEELHLFQDNSGMYGGNYGQKSHYESHIDEFFLKRD